MLKQMFAFAGAVALVIGFGSTPAIEAAAKKKAPAPDTSAIFKKLDANKDGKLDLDEFKKLFDELPKPKAKKGAEAAPINLEDVFKSLDANSDKFLDEQEFKGVIPAVTPAKK
jgi:Ca2+-binding EF-hand superfamily protein